MPDYSSSTAAASTHGAKKEDRDSVVQLLEAEVVINLLRKEISLCAKPFRCFYRGTLVVSLVVKL